MIGFLGSISPGPNEPALAVFHQGLSETGYVEGQNMAIEYRRADGRYDRLPALTTDLNLKAAKPLGPTVPPSILARADEVIE